MQHKSYRFLIIILISLITFSACKKVQDTATPASPGTPPVTSPAVSLEDKIKDSTLLYTREFYLWYNQIPASFNPRIFANPDSIMRGMILKGIRQFSIEPGFPNPVDRFSFALKKVEYDNLSSGNSDDFGFNVFFFGSPSVTDDLRVKYVEKESPAGRAGIKRGWRIIKINGNSNISTNNVSLVGAAIFNSTNTTFTFKKPDGSTVDITLNASSYQTRPVMKDSVYTINSKNIGYLVFNSFLGDTDQINSEFNRVFTRFTNANVSDVVVDLRYNGGGYVSIAERLSNYLAPFSANGSLMMKQQFNDKNSRYNKSTFYNKEGALNLPRLFFIVSSSTASASELVINNLKPFMQVFLIGRNTTHGKPVGFFPIPVGDWYIFPVSFKTVNKDGKSDYYNGFTPDAIKDDGLDKDFGDITETSLASAIKYITTGAFRLQAEHIFDELPAVKKANSILDESSFKGTLDTRKF